MVRTGKTKKVNTDFKHRKAKVGGRKLAPVNSTKTDFQFATLRLAKVDEAGDLLQGSSSLPTSVANISFSQCMSNAKHYNTNVRRGALQQLVMLFRHSTASLRMALSDVITMLGARLMDVEGPIRSAALDCLLVVLRATPPSAVAAHMPVLVAHIASGLTKLHAAQRLDTLAALLALLAAAPQLLPPHAAHLAPLLAQQLTAESTTVIVSSHVAGFTPAELALATDALNAAASANSTAPERTGKGPLGGIKRPRPMSAKEAKDAKDAAAALKRARAAAGTPLIKDGDDMGDEGGYGAASGGAVLTARSRGKLTSIESRLAFGVALLQLLKVCLKHKKATAHAEQTDTDKAVPPLVDVAEPLLVVSAGTHDGTHTDKHLEERQGAFSTLHTPPFAQSKDGLDLTGGPAASSFGLGTQILRSTATGRIAGLTTKDVQKAVKGLIRMWKQCATYGSKGGKGGNPSARGDIIARALGSVSGPTVNLLPTGLHRCVLVAECLRHLMAACPEASSHEEGGVYTPPDAQWVAAHGIPQSDGTVKQPTADAAKKAEEEAPTAAAAATAAVVSTASSLHADPLEGLLPSATELLQTPASALGGGGEGGPSAPGGSLPSWASPQALGLALPEVRAGLLKSIVATLGGVFPVQANSGAHSGAGETAPLDVDSTEGGEDETHSPIVALVGRLNVAVSRCLLVLSPPAGLHDTLAQAVPPHPSSVARWDELSAVAFVMGVDVTPDALEHAASMGGAVDTVTAASLLGVRLASRHNKSLAALRNEADNRAHAVTTWCARRLDRIRTAVKERYGWWHPLVGWVLGTLRAVAGAPANEDATAEEEVAARAWGVQGGSTSEVEAKAFNACVARGVKGGSLGYPTLPGGDALLRCVAAVLPSVDATTRGEMLGHLCNIFAGAAPRSGVRAGVLALLADRAAEHSWLLPHLAPSAPRDLWSLRSALAAGEPAALATATQLCHILWRWSISLPARGPTGEAAQLVCAQSTPLFATLKGGAGGVKQPFLGPVMHMEAAGVRHLLAALIQLVGASEAPHAPPKLLRGLAWAARHPACPQWLHTELVHCVHTLAGASGAQLGAASKLLLTGQLVSSEEAATADLGPLLAYAGGAAASPEAAVWEWVAPPCTQLMLKSALSPHQAPPSQWRELVDGTVEAVAQWVGQVHSVAPHVATALKACLPVLLGAGATALLPASPLPAAYVATDFAPALCDLLAGTTPPAVGGMPASHSALATGASQAAAALWRGRSWAVKAVLQHLQLEVGAGRAPDCLPACAGLVHRSAAAAAARGEDSVEWGIWMEGGVLAALRSLNGVMGGVTAGLPGASQAQIGQIAAQLSAAQRVLEDA